MASKWVLLTDNEREEITKKIPKLGKKLIKDRITVASAKAKGMGFQRKVCELISELIGIPYTSDDSSLISPRTSGCNGTDIILRGEALQKFPFAIECKASEQLNLVNAIEQAKSNTKDGIHWLLFHKRKALKEAIVIMDWGTFTTIWNA